jgi:hypothetical protein
MRVVACARFTSMQPFVDVPFPPSDLSFFIQCLKSCAQTPKSRAIWQYFDFDGYFPAFF